MDASPRGHEIRRIGGDGAAITDRGTEMESLGLQMRESATLLKAIADGAEGKGYSIERIRENVGDLHVDLGRAGERYEPSGRVIREYGEVLVEQQPTLNRVAANCVELWTAYETARADYVDADSATPPVGETPEQQSQREQETGDLRTASADAYTAWQEEAAKYDVPFETWDEAYDAAVAGLRDANDRGVKDSFWDDALPAIEAILVVLAVAGIVLAVLALVIGGPLIILLGAIAGLLTLGFTIWKVAAGRGSGWDIFTAALGVFPFGRLAKLGNLFRGSGRFLSRLGSFSRGFGEDVIGLTAFREVRALSGFTAFLRGPVTNSRGNLTQSQNIINQVRTFADEVSGVSYTGTARWLNRITGGPSGAVSSVVSSAYAAAGPAVTGRVNTALAGTALDGIQYGNNLLTQGLNVLDSVGKPGFGVYELGGQALDALSSPTDRWATELARS
ncbi:hypothetical protein [Agromyces bauzanensis]